MQEFGKTIWKRSLPVWYPIHLCLLYTTQAAVRSSWSEVLLCWLKNTASNLEPSDIHWPRARVKEDNRGPVGFWVRECRWSLYQFPKALCSPFESLALNERHRGNHLQSGPALFHGAAPVTQTKRCTISYSIAHPFFLTRGPDCVRWPKLFVPLDLHPKIKMCLTTF